MEFEIHPLKFSSEELKAIPQRHSSYFMTSCLAASEVGVLLRIYLSALTTAQITQRETVAIEYASVQLSIIQRKLSSAVVEFATLIESQLKVMSRKQDNAMAHFQSSATSALAEITTHPGYAFARNLRNRVAHHFDLAHMGEMLREAGTERDYTIYLNDIDGNCLYPVADHLLLANSFDTDEGKVQFEQYDDWVKRASAAVMALHNTFCLDFLSTHFKDKYADTIRVEIPAELAPTPDALRLPIMLDLSLHQIS